MRLLRREVRAAVAGGATPADALAALRSALVGGVMDS